MFFYVIQGFFRSPAIRHDILDFCVRELGALGEGGGEYLHKFPARQANIAIATHGARAT